MNALNVSLIALFGANSTLVSKASGGIHHQSVPQAKRPPYLVFEKVGGSPVFTLKVLAVSDLLYGFHGYGKDTDTKGGAEIAGEIIELAEATLQDCEVAVGDRTLQYARKETDMPDSTSLDETDGQLVYRRAFIGRLMLT